MTAMTWTNLKMAVLLHPSYMDYSGDIRRQTAVTLAYFLTDLAYHQRTIGGHIILRLPTIIRLNMPLAYLSFDLPPIICFNVPLSHH